MNCIPIIRHTISVYFEKEQLRLNIVLNLPQVKLNYFCIRADLLDI